MIKIEVEDYCQQCIHFEADVEKPEYYYHDDVPVVMGHTIIRCEHRHHCAYLKQTLEKKGRQDES